MTKKEHKRAEQLIQDIMGLGHQQRAKRIELQLLTGEQGQAYCHRCDHVEMCMWYGFEGCEFRQERRPKGKWIGIEYDGYADGNPVYHRWQCQRCGNEISTEEPPDYCCDCGADMRSEE